MVTEVAGGTTTAMCTGNEASIAFLGLGSNLGDRETTMRAAVRTLAGHPQIDVNLETGIAALYETAPVGGPADQAPFLNSAVRITTTLSPGELLRAILSIEANLGRSRGVRWESRIIDIDVLLFDNVACDGPTLTLPHPRLHLRRFVLEPLSEIAGDVIHPLLRECISRLADSLRGTGEEEKVVRVAGRSWAIDALPAAEPNESTACGLD